ncbi:CAAX amino terminal protease self- immunity [Microbacterium oxydans]|uniref:CAAX amino terminal protease self-immunity n=1 Tax=Microbacterium oxydans TaxID=82380 RepID=A0A0F0KHW7_9MICO|nr:type II CAAX endopeptidase family protein [Microbacterium oxydans]KJL20453.1 CAAX amino terminal protease self- immunity [Microbacterium oxydans]
MNARELPFIADARHGRRVTPWWLGIIMFFVFFLLGIGVLAAIAIIWPVDPGSALSQWQEGVGTLITILLVFAWVVLFERRHVRTLGFRNPGKGVLRLLLGVVVGVVMISIPILLLWASGAYVAAEPPSGGGGGVSVVPIVLLLLLTVIAQGSSEEVLTRGFLVQSLGQKLPLVAVVLVQAFIFVGVHGVLTRPLGFATIFLFAVFAVFVVLREGSLWLICGIHAGWNWAMGNVFGLSVSGLEPKQNAIFFLSVDEDVPDWITGGALGTEGSAAAAIMIAVATAIAIILYRRARSSTGVSDGLTATATATAKA